jgi:uncharacterized phiE125 gp8 family phage protein
MAFNWVAGPAEEPVSLDEAKTHLRVDGTDEDSLIQMLIATARRDVETLTLHKLITQTWDWYMDDWPSTPIVMPFPPLQSVTGIYYTLEGAAEATWSSSNYIVDAYSIPGRIALQSTASWPSGELIEINGVRIRFVCGFGTAEDVDERARQAMLLLIGHYYEHREEVIVERGVNIQMLPMAAGMLCNDLRMKVKSF